MKGSTIALIFLNIIIVTPGNLQTEHDPSIPFNGLGFNSVVYALRLLGIANTDKDPSIDWKIAFVRLAEKFADSDKFKLMLGTRSRVDFLERILGPPGPKLSGDRITRWTNSIFGQKNNSLVEEFRARMKKEGLTEEMFARGVTKLCQDTNERAPHLNIELPDVVSDNVITATLRLMKIIPDAIMKRTYKLIVDPLKDFDEIAERLQKSTLDENDSD